MHALCQMKKRPGPMKDHVGFSMVACGERFVIFGGLNNDGTIGNFGATLGPIELVFKIYLLMFGIHILLSLLVIVNYFYYFCAGSINGIVYYISAEDGYASDIYRRAPTRAPSYGHVYKLIELLYILIIEVFQALQPAKVITVGLS